MRPTTNSLLKIVCLFTAIDVSIGHTISVFHLDEMITGESEGRSSAEVKVGLLYISVNSLADLIRLRG